MSETINKKNRKLCIALIILTFGINSLGFSQFVKQGSILGNGSAAYKTTKNGGSHSTQLQLTTWVGYFVKDNLVLGASFNYDFLSQNTFAYFPFNATSPYQVVSVSSVDKEFTIGPVVRYYFNGGFFLNAQYSWGIQRFTMNSVLYTPYPSYNNLGIFRGGLGYAFRVTKRIMLEPMACFTSRVSTDITTKMESNESGYIFMISFTMLLKLE